MSRGVRVTGGEFRGRLLSVPRGVRPSSGTLREALFSIWGERVAGARFLDLFAGTGMVAIEAAGRGAAKVVAIEDDPAVAKALEANLVRTGAAVGLRRGLLPKGLARALGGDAPFDLVFADPPYAFADLAGLLAAIAPHLAGEGEVALEHGARERPPDEIEGLTLRDRRQYGDSALSFYSR